MTETETFDGAAKPRLIPGKSFLDVRGAFTPFPLSPGAVQANVSVSAPGVVRGMHWQETRPQGKLVACLSGAIHDICVDVRAGTSGFGRVHEFELRGGTGDRLFVPKGFAHGFEVLGDVPATVLYVVDEGWAPADERGFRWTCLGARWRTPESAAVLSDKDRALPLAPIDFRSAIR